MLILFILFSHVFFSTCLHTLCFTGSPCCNVSYYTYISIWPYYIVIHFTYVNVINSPVNTISMIDSNTLYVLVCCGHTLPCRFNTATHREEPSQINVSLQEKLLAAKLSAVCTVYKQWLMTFGCNCGFRTAVKHRILFHISAIALTAFK